MGKRLPKNWVETDLDTVLSRITNGSGLKQSEAPFEGSYPISRIETIWDESIDLNRVKYVKPSKEDIEKYGLTKGDVLFSHINSDKHLGKTAVFDLDEIVIHGINLLLLRVVPQFNGYLLNYLLRHYRFSGKFIEVAQRSVNQSSINQKKLKGFKINLPPLAEQQRIVDKLNTLFAHLEKIKIRLDKVPQLLKNFRQAILNQAVTGKITEDWKKGKNLKDWNKVLLKKYAIKIGSGSTPDGGSENYQSDGIPLVRSMNIHFNGIRLKGLAFINEEQAEKLKNVIIEKGDVLLNITGASIGRVCLADEHVVGARVNQHVCIIRPSNKLKSNFLNIYLGSSIIQDYINKENYGVTRQALTKTQIENFEIPLPEIIEQEEIVKLVENLFNKIDVIKNKYDVLNQQLENLPQAILAKAFNGELVEQLPTDGNAKDLLEEIKNLKKEVPLNSKREIIRKTKVGSTKKSPVATNSVYPLHSILTSYNKGITEEKLYSLSGMTQHYFLTQLDKEIEGGMIEMTGDDNGLLKCKSKK